MQPLIRTSRDGDIPAITAIYGHAVTHGTASFELEAPDAEELARRRAAVLDEGYPYVVAERAGAVVGYAYGSAYRPRPAYRWTVEDSVYVASAVQGQGVGRALLAALVAECEHRGFRLMVAVIGDRDSRASIRLHESLDFTHAGVLDPVGYKHGRWLATVLMQRVLGEGARTAPGRLATQDRRGSISSRPPGGACRSP